MVIAALQIIRDAASGRVVGCEALARKVSGTPPTIHGPGVFARDATSWDWWLIDLGILDYLRRRATRRPLPAGTLFVNVAAETLAETPAWRMWLVGLEALMSSWPGAVVVEVSERLAAEACDLDARLADIRRRGGLAAIDDVDGRPANLDRLYAHDWDVAKIDWRPCSRSGCPVEDIVGHCAGRRIYVVLEGVETPQDIVSARTFGVHAIQGFGVGRPFVVDVT